MKTVSHLTPQGAFQFIFLEESGMKWKKINAISNLSRYCLELRQELKVLFMLILLFLFPGNIYITLYDS